MKLVKDNLKKGFFNKLKSAWEQAFPPEIPIEKIIILRKDKLKKEKEFLEIIYTEEELLNFEKNIPLWKKGAIIPISKVITDPIYNKKHFKIKEFIRKKYKDNKDVTELLDEIDGINGSIEIMKDNLKQKVLYSDSVVLNASIKTIENIKEKINSDATVEMRKRDPNFDFDLFEKEVQYIFDETYQAYLQHDLKYLEQVCAGEALGHFKMLISEHISKFGVPKYKNILNVSYPNLISSFLLSNKTPVFCFNINFQEIYCLVDPLDNNVILDGSENRMISCEYLIYITIHPDPEIEKIGHSWLIFKVEQKNRLKQLI